MTTNKPATQLLFLPGLGNSDADHWQSLWGLKRPNSLRFQPGSWDEPNLDDWLQALDTAIDEAEAPVLLVAHSLACLLVAHWVQEVTISDKKSSDERAHRVAQVSGALLVAVPDPGAKAFPPEASDFRNAPARPLPFPALVVASSDDPYATTDYARQQAATWQADFVDVGACGHINAASQLGEWPQGWALLEALA
ncbi:RBBP9/YdeN family alpha/beta hydrolase [Vreelandella titanicae]|uniref:RBBP9/YdeN family alpha/beta hydrolase n=1 Tax=Vreelandella titanicae TaxID=664683 RepID=UPI001681526B|nr:alpha/beta hydrolase [Halomonas titanicae]QNU63253.1 alpha/beta hydrolase [Halomonas titanicae]